MRNDLAALPAWCAQAPDKDKVVIPNELLYPSQIKDMRHMLAGFVTHDDLCKGRIEGPYQLQLLGMEPSLLLMLNKQWKDSLTHITLPEQPQKVVINLLYGRKLSATYMHQYADNEGANYVETAQQLKDFIAHQTGCNWVVKYPFSSSGRGIAQYTTEQIVSLCSTNFKYPLLLEPFYDVESDWANEFFIDPQGKIHYLGLSYFVTNKFKYLYNILLPQKQLNAILSKRIGEEEVIDTTNKQILFLMNEVAPYYRGYVGIDMFVYFDANKQCKLYPCCEVNTRKTMGHIALELQKRWCSQQQAYLFGIEHIAGKQKAEWLQETNNNSPIFSAQHKLQKGTICLTPILPATQFTAYLKTDAHTYN